MEIFDALHLARLQFAFTVSIHIIFPSISIGMASFLARPVAAAPVKPPHAGVNPLAAHKRACCSHPVS